MSKIPCSVPLLTLNVRKELERLLPLIVPVFDDVFIMDGNSTDGTQEFACSLGLRVEKQFESDEPNRRITDFRAMRLKLWSKARRDWLFLLDADEVPTPELIELVREVVAGNDVHTAHRIWRLAQLPDGRIVKHALYYPFLYPHIFSLKSGVTIADRAVHERLVFPEGVRIVDHPEAIIDPQPGARAWRERQHRYLKLEGQRVSDTSWHQLFRWIVWYNVRSFFGQFFRAIRASVTGFVKREAALPWSYNYIFLEYRILSLVTNVKAWVKKRRERKAA